MDTLQRFRPLGYVQIADLSTAVGLGPIPAGATSAVIMAEGQAVRFRDDGQAPTASVGMPLAVAQEFAYTGNLSAVTFIQQTAGAKLNVAFYRGVVL